MAVEDALPDAGSGEPRSPEPRPTILHPTVFDRTVVIAAAATFLALVLSAEAASRVATGSGFWYSRFDFAGTVTSVPELQDRIRWAASRPRPVFLLGDSVLGASALMEHGAAAPRRATVAARLAESESRRASHVESLAADGLLLPDLEAEGRLLGPARMAPRRILVVLNFRMFAGEFQDPSKALSREFLEAGPREESFADRAYRASSFLRSTVMLKSLWYFPTRRDFFRRAAERVLGRDSDPEIQEAALRLKVSPYYRDRWSVDAPAFRSLERLLAEIGAARVVLTPQNPDFIEDSTLFAANRRTLGELVRARGPSIDYRDWADRYPPDRFLDHCHLTAAGNREYAAELARWIDP